jgi:hypothetical protein
LQFTSTTKPTKKIKMGMETYARRHVPVLSTELIVPATRYSCERE